MGGVGRLLFGVAAGDGSRAVIYAVVIAAGAVFTSGTYLLLSRDLFRCVIGLAMLGGGVNLLVFAAGGVVTEVPAIIPESQYTLGIAANPVPQALVLTSIVISFALFCFSLVLVWRLMAIVRSDDVGVLRASEPSPSDPVKPVLEDAQPRVFNPQPTGVLGGGNVKDGTVEDTS